MTDAADWRGRVGDVWAREHARTDRAFAAVGVALGQAIVRHAPVHGHAVDIGCGVGSTALALAAARPGLRITGLDLSPALIAVAQARARGVLAGGIAGDRASGFEVRDDGTGRGAKSVQRAPGDGGGARDAATGEIDPAFATGSGGRAAASKDGSLAFLVGDVGVMLPTIAPLDLLVSRHGVMFFADPVAGFRTLRGSVRLGAPLVFSCFRRRTENDWVTAVEAALRLETTSSAAPYAPGPFALGEAMFLRHFLTAAGWSQIEAVAHDVDYIVGGGVNAVDDALDFFGRIGPVASLLTGASAGERARFNDRLRDLFATRIRNGAVTFTAAIWVVSARAGKELP